MSVLAIPGLLIGIGIGAAIGLPLGAFAGWRLVQRMVRPS